MKKNILLLALLLFVTAIKSFSQPQWKFHIAYEDATGARDTIWFIWDESATYFGNDVELGEVPLSLNLDEFNVYLHNPGLTYVDTFKTIAFPYNEFFEDEVYAFNFVLPIKITWDTSLLHAPFLPPEPVGWVNYARLENDYFFLVNNSTTGQYFDMTLTDQIIAPDTNINDPWFWEPGRHFPMWVFLHQDPSTYINKSNGCSSDRYLIFPNPARNKLTTIFPTDILEIKIYNNVGMEMFGTDVKTNKEIIDISDFQNGIYFINFININKQNNYKKFIKTN